MTSIWVVTLADREPYLGWSAALGAAVRSLGCEYYSHADCRGELPWQAKRFAVRAAFEAGADCVYFSDADCIVRDPKALAELLVRRAVGVHTQRLLPTEQYVRRGGIQRGDRDGHRTWSIYLSFLARANACASHHMQDWLLCYSMSPARGVALCDFWDRIGERLLAESPLTWSDGVSVGLAAAALGLPVLPDLDRGLVARALEHLHNGRLHGYYISPGYSL